MLKTGEIKLKQLAAAVKILNDSGLTKEKIKIIGQEKETIVKAFVEAVKAIPGGADGKHCPEAVSQFYNLIMQRAKVEPVKVEKIKKAGVGIISTIIESIKKKALTKSEILEILVQKFPDRPADGMKSTISIQLGPTRLATKYNLTKDGDAYRIEG
jgi:hypothetical protein